MSTARRVLVGAISLGAGQSAGYLLSFVRRVVTARLLTQADFGIAATFMMTVTLLEMASDMAAGRLLVQSKDGDQAQMQGVVHAFEVGRGLLLGVILFSLAIPIADLFGVPEAYRDYQILALAPVLRGFRHLDVSRMQRELRFGPQIGMEFASSVVTLAATWPLIWYFGSYTAILWVVLMREAMLTGMSHLMAERPYRWAWCRESAREVFAFGWPLALNGILMCAAVQGDQVIVGAAYSMEELAVYAAAVFLVMTPVMPAGRLTGALALPVLSEVQDEPSKFGKRLGEATKITTISGFFVIVAFVVFGEGIMTLVYGASYAGGGTLIAWLGLSQGLRLLRMLLNVAAMSLGDTRNTLIANMGRAVGVVLALGVASTGQPMWCIAAAGFLGEVLALGFATWRIKRLHSIRCQPIVLSTLGMLFVGLTSWLIQRHVQGAGLYSVTLAFGILSCWFMLRNSMFIGLLMSRARKMRVRDCSGARADV